MNFYVAIFLFLGILTSFSTFSAMGQTCRVNTGCCPNGASTYIEVFEYDYVEIKPEFPGGSCSMLKFINEHRQYPAQAYAVGIEGRVTCSFVVNSDGSVSNISVIKGVEESLNLEAVRLLSEMPSWTPGKNAGRCVPVRVVYSVPFRK